MLLTIRSRLTTNSFHVNKNNSYPPKKLYFTKQKSSNEKSGIVLPFFANLFNVWLNRSQLDSPACLCIPSVDKTTCHVVSGKLQLHS